MVLRGPDPHARPAENGWSPVSVTWLAEMGRLNQSSLSLLPVSRGVFVDPWGDVPVCVDMHMDRQDR